MQEERFTLRRYAAYVFSIGITGCVATANCAWAWSLDDGIFRWLMICVTGGADIGAVIFLASMLSAHAEGDHVGAMAAAVLWLVCGVMEIGGAEAWLRSSAFTASAPSLTATEKHNQAVRDLERANARVDELRRKIDAATDTDALRNLRKSEREAKDEAARLKPLTYAAEVVPVNNALSGNERILACALWLLSQLSWRVAMGRERRPQTFVHRDIMMDTLSPDSLSSRTVSGDRLSAADTVPGQPVRMVSARTADTVRPVLPTVRADSQVIDSFVPSLSACPGTLSADTVRADSEADTLSAVRGQSVRPVRPVLVAVPKDSFADEVYRLARSGRSVREIASALGCGKTKVHNVMKGFLDIKAESTYSGK